MDNGTREIAQHRETFGLDDFTQMEAVEFAETAADFLQDIEREPGRALEQLQHFLARNEINAGVLRGHGRGRTGLLFDDRHFAENLPGTQL